MFKFLPNLKVTNDGPNKQYPLRITSFPGNYIFKFPVVPQGFDINAVQVDRGYGWVDAILSDVPPLSKFVDIYDPISKIPSLRISTNLSSLSMPTITANPCGPFPLEISILLSRDQLSPASVEE